MFTAITAVLCLSVGIIAGQLYGRKVEQKAVAKILSEFAQVDQDARSLVMRCYSRLANGVKSELKKLGI